MNVSKSGLGVSAGVKGAHIGIGPKGPYVSGGKDGVYFGEKLDLPTSGVNATESTKTKLVLVIIAAAILFLAGMVLVALFRFMGVAFNFDSL